MCKQSEICVVCLKNDCNLIKTSEIDINNTKWITKLAACVPEINWHENYSICNNCIQQLNISYQFRIMCLQSDEERKQMQSIKEEIIIEEETFVCFHCNLNFSTKDILTEHIRSEHTIKQENTFYCETLIEEELLEDIPIKRNKRITEFSCVLCDKAFHSSKKLITHSLQEHNIDAKQVKPFKCDLCNSRFSNSSNLQHHKKYHDGSRTNICSFCGKGFITKNDLTIHEKQHLNKREYKCEFCPKCFNTHKDLRSHKLVVHTDPQLWKHVCGICDKRFPIKSNYDQHMRRHNGEKRFCCHICEKRFTDKAVLQKHFRSHSNVRAHKCEHCEKEYKESRVLAVHLAKVHGIGNAKIPERVKKYFCHICPKSYFAKNKLTRHMFTHSGERPYSCSVCEKRFTDKSYVKHHLRKAHNVFQSDENK